MLQQTWNNEAEYVCSEMLDRLSLKLVIHLYPISNAPLLRSIIHLGLRITKLDTLYKVGLCGNDDSSCSAPVALPSSANRLCSDLR